jgi:hypothetical protein
MEILMPLSEALLSIQIHSLLAFPLRMGFLRFAMDRTQSLTRSGGLEAVDLKWKVRADFRGFFRSICLDCGHLRIEEALSRGHRL